MGFNKNCTVCKGTGWMPKKGSPEDAETAKLFGLSVDELTLQPCNADGNDMGCYQAENFGGDPEGKLAKALERAREKAKQPRKPLKIERLKAESPQVDDEGMLGRIRKVRIVGIEDNNGKTDRNGNPIQDVYFYRDLLDSGEADWRIHTDSERTFLSRFKPDKQAAESFNADDVRLRPCVKCNATGRLELDEPYFPVGSIHPRYTIDCDECLHGVYEDTSIPYSDKDYHPFDAENRPPSYMADSDAHKLMEASWRINSFVESTEEYPQWWKSKLSVAASNVDNLADYLDYAMSDDYDAENFEASRYSVSLIEEEGVPDYYPHLAPEATIVQGRGRYRFNRYGSDGMTHLQYRFATKNAAIEWLCYQSHTYIWVKPNQPQYDFPPNTHPSLIKKWYKSESFRVENRSLAKRSWDALNNVETAVGTVGLAHMIGLGAIIGGSFAFLKGRKSNSKTEQ